MRNDSCWPACAQWRGRRRRRRRAGSIPTDPQPTCTMCPGYYIPLAELAGVYEEGGRREPDSISRSAISRSARRTSASAWCIAASWTRRRRTRSPNTIRSARSTTSSTARRRWCSGPTSPTGSGGPRRCRPCASSTAPATMAQRFATASTYNLKAGDVVVIPAGTGHWFTKIDDHIDYLMVRIDPDKVTPLKSEAQSKEYLTKPAPRNP